MVHRVFNAAEIPCHCLVEETGSGLLRVPALRISRSEALLDTALPLTEGSVTEVILELGGHRSVVQKAQVLSSGVGRLRLKWLFTRNEDEDGFEDVLMECAGLSSRPVPESASFAYFERTPPEPLEAPDAAWEVEAETTAVDPPPDSDGGVRAPASRRPDAPRGEPVKTDEGQLDLEATLKSRARRVAISRIAAHQKTVRVLDMSTITGLIQEAVEEAMVDMRPSEEERQRLLAETEKNFAERLQEFKAEKADLKARATDLDRQLSEARTLLAEERRKVIDTERFTVSDDAIAKLEIRLSRLLERTVRSKDLDQDRKNELRAVVGQILDDERERISTQARAVKSDRIRLLERKISRLARSLEKTREDRDHARQTAEALQSSRSLPFRPALKPGISGEDPLRSDKLALLQELAEENHELRRRMQSRGQVV